MEAPGGGEEAKQFELRGEGSRRGEKDNRRRATWTIEPLGGGEEAKQCLRGPEDKREEAI